MSENKLIKKPDNNFSSLKRNKFNIHFELKNLRSSRPEVFCKKRVEFLRTPFFKEYLQWLLLKISQAASKRSNYCQVATFGE